jgi:transketolase
VRDAFITRLAQRASENSRINLVVGDLGFGVVTDFAEAYPLQFLNAGVAEQSMIGIAAGMAAAGRKVFVYSIANFPTMRCLEQIRNDVCYHGLDVTIVSVGAGLAYGTLGYSHHAVEDIAVMRAFPGLTIYSPCDPLEVTAAVDAICETSGPTYLRLGKNREPVLHAAPPDVASGAPLLLRDGTDLTLFVTGAIAAVGLEAASVLESDHGVSVRVLSVPRIKPLDTGALVAAAVGTRGIATLEEHSVVGGFGSAVLEAFAADGVRLPVLSLGLRDDVQSAVGSQEYLRNLAGLSVGEITERLLRFR